jgi:hypothetical protein
MPWNDAALTREHVKELGQELAAMPDATLDAAVRRAKLQLNPDVLPNLEVAGLAGAYLAAHLATVTTRRGANGAVASESVGDVSRTYAAPRGAGGEGELDSTPYGQAYRDLIRRCVVGMAIL